MVDLALLVAKAPLATEDAKEVAASDTGDYGLSFDARTK